MNSRLVLGACLLVGAAPQVHAAMTDMLVGIDGKIAYLAEGQANVDPTGDAVLVMDISNPAKPRIRASLPLANSLVGPPTNLQITPDGKLGVVANSVVHIKEGAAWKAAPDDKLFVIDLTAEPPKLVDTLTVGKQPSGLAISRKGDLMLIANRAGKGVTVLSITGMTVKVLANVDMGQEVAGVAITPDGKRAFAVMNLVNKVAVLEIDGQKVTYDKAMDIPAAFNPYNIDITPNGKFAVASSTGAGGLNGDALTVIDTSGAHPHVVSLTSPGTGAEGFTFSPDGKWAVTPLLMGTGNKQSDYAYVKKSEAVLLSVAANGELRVVDRKPVGGLPEGVVISGDSKYVFIGNYIDKDIQTFRISGGKLVQVGAAFKLPGQPASMRGVAR